MTKDRKTQLKRLTRQTFVERTQEDLAGRSENHKELWEQCSTPEEREYVETELKFLVRVIGSLN